MSTKLSLRKANQIQLELKDRIDSIELSPTVIFGIYDDIQSGMQEAKLKYGVALAKHDQLHNARWFLRRGIGNKNAESGIADILTQMAQKKGEVNFLSGLLYKISDRESDVEKLVGKQRAKKDTENLSTAFMMREIHGGVVSPEEREEMAKKVRLLKKDISELNDQCIGLNSSVMLVISDEVEQILKEEDLI